MLRREAESSFTVCRQCAPPYAGTGILVFPVHPGFLISREPPLMRDPPLGRGVAFYFEESP
jgi:hypothetical protein